MSKQIQDVFIVAANRTPVAKARGAFRHTRPDDLLVKALHGTLAKVPQLPLEQIDDVMVGCAMPEGEQGMNVARSATLMANLPDSVPGVTVNRFCSSGIQTIAMAHERIALGNADIILAGGTESMTRIPMGGFHFRGNVEWFEHDEAHGDIAFGMGITAERVAKQWGITREAQDAFSYESHRRALAAIANGYFSDEIIPVEVVTANPDLAQGVIVENKKKITMDEGPRADTSLEVLKKLRPVFALNGSVTAGSSSQMSDGAGICILASEKIVKEYNLTPLARMLGFSVTGVPADIMGIGPAKAIPKVLAKTGIKLDDIDWIELNEAFAAQTLAVMKELELDHAKVNPLGGAIALGHPLGATGAIRTATLLHGLKRRQQKYGMVTMCIGTGMGAAGIFEYLG